MQVALCQVPVGDDPKENLAIVRRAMVEAGDADIAIFPEASLVRFGGRVAEHAESLDGPWLTALAEAAREHGTAVIAGVFESAPDGRVYNTAVAIDADGHRVDAYRKLHLFDAFDYKESDRVAPGDRPVVVELAGLRIGLVTCYDIRFPELARRLVDEGAEMLAVIAAWAQGPFKEEHWVTLVRARAIENTVWVAAVDKAPEAPAFGATGVGRSMLVDPMGVVQADLGPSPSVQIVDVYPAETLRVRTVLPALTHRRRDILG
jgi:predicted amidohydrolase